MSLDSFRICSAGQSTSKPHLMHTERSGISMPRILSAAEPRSYRTTAIPSSPATTLVAMIAERSVKRRPMLVAAPPASSNDANTTQQGEHHCVWLRHYHVLNTIDKRGACVG